MARAKVSKTAAITIPPMRWFSVDRCLKLRPRRAFIRSSSVRPRVNFLDLPLVN